MSLSIAPYVATPQWVIRRMLLLARLNPGEMVYDLGCGDGKILITAAQEFGARGVGVELREDLALKAQRRVLELGLRNLVRIIHGNLFKVDIGRADVVSLYLTTSANEKVRPKLERELKSGARIISHDYQIRGWKPKKTERLREDSESSIFGRIFPSTHTIYLYEV